MGEEREPAEVVNGYEIGLADDGTELGPEARTADRRVLQTRAFLIPDRASKLAKDLAEAVATWQKMQAGPDRKQ